jgi:hypothetical protein
MCWKSWCSPRSTSSAARALAPVLALCLAVLVLLVLWALLSKVSTAAVSGPHTAVVEIKGEIASGADASAEFVVAAMRSAFEDRVPGRGAADQLARRQPGAGRHHQRRDERLKAIHNKPIMRWSRKPAPRRPTTSPRRPTRSCRQGQHRRQHRRADGRLRLSPA